MTLADRFWEKVDRRGPDECWLWIGATGSVGYGKIGIGQRSVDAHRVSWELQHGPIPEGVLVCHRCDTRLCVNPAHLFLGSYRENNQDTIRKGRAMTGERHHFAKLTRPQVVEIRTALTAGATQQSLADRFSVSSGAIQAIHAGRNWKEVSSADQVPA